MKVTQYLSEDAVFVIKPGMGLVKSIKTAVSGQSLSRVKHERIAGLPTTS